MQIKRSRERIVVDIPIVVTTVLDSLEGTIVDLSEGGAQVVGCSLPARSQCQIDLDGHITFGTVQWSEEDRMGIRFPYELNDGPLYERLDLARAAKRAPAAFHPRFGAAVAGGGFGRRID
ncbi:PilZ domain-containing protein [Sphingobium sp. HBC34]|uniref:PilZ domain-containing protein n=1 Tax=Sphingobium cyanobacteriorum TaxID=3063954 RepID=A0ABT8ZQW9_9SPHN|nr:PilZ domain-containing protein [Sphingobium sp. HBC34]MDO7836942.1 PilZ domain-containing protein [Sphingobium sp. HBC34]